MKGGKFKSNFSRLDAQHPHAWDFYDIALPYRAFLGDEGLGGEKGVQVTWLPAWPIYTQWAWKCCREKMSCFSGQMPRTGPHAFSFFVKSSLDTSDNSTLYFGPAVLFGKRETPISSKDAEFDGDSTLYEMEVGMEVEADQPQGADPPERVPLSGPAR